MALALLVIFPLGWIGWFYPWDDLYDRSGTPVGGDFPVYYVLGKLTAEGRTGELYDLAAQQREMRAVLPGLPKNSFLPALYPPYVATALSPLGRLSYPVAYGVFFAASLALLAGAAWTWRKTLPLASATWAGTALLAGAALPVLWESLIGGQASPLAMFVFAAAAALALGNRPLAAGAILALAAYKPNVLALVGLGLIVRFPRLLVGAAPAGLALLALAWGTLGKDVCLEYLKVPGSPEGRRALAAPPKHKFHGLAAAMPATRNDQARIAFFGICAAGAIVVAWRWRQAPGNAAAAYYALALLGLLQLLGNPYVPTYDLLLLLPTGVFAAALPGACRHRHATAIAPAAQTPKNAIRAGSLRVAGMAAASP